MLFLASSMELRAFFATAPSVIWLRHTFDRGPGFERRSFRQWRIAIFVFFAVKKDLKDLRSRLKEEESRGDLARVVLRCSFVRCLSQKGTIST
jgi:hypothetical protein